MPWKPSPGVLLIIISALAIAAANSPLAGDYRTLFHHDLGWSPVPRLHSVHDWINDGLMAVFFFVTGLEIKREILGGALSTPARRRLPIIAAAAGMAAPAVIYLATTGLSLPAARGWAIPAATDIAFALGVMGLLGNRVPASLRLFLLTVAVADDLGAVAIIALFYTARIEPAWAIAAGLALAGLVLANRSGVHRARIYLPLGLLLWVCVLHSGIHATVAGVALAFTIPYPPHGGKSLLLRLEHALIPWSAYLIVPLFGFANAGIALSGLGAEALLAPIPLAVTLGLFLGKQAGVLGAILLCERTGFAPRPHGATLLQLWGMTALCGIGFTMSLFIGGLAFPGHPEIIEQAKLGVLAGSLGSALLGYAILRLAPARPKSGPKTGPSGNEA